MLRARLRQLIQTQISGVNFAVTRPPNPAYGEFSSNAPLRASIVLRQSPAQIGQTLLLRLAPDFDGQIELVAGRLNFFMSDHSIVESLERAAREGAHYGSGDSLAGKRVLVEYVSSDPTGPLPFAAGRRAVIGEAICRLLEDQGARVTREFYLNDATTSSKNRLLGEGVANYYLKAFGQDSPAPDGAFDNAFVRAVAAELTRRDGAKWLGVSSEERLAACSQAALEAAIESQRATLEQMGTRFDTWVSETAMVNDGRVNSAIELLQSRGQTYENAGALWLKTSAFGDDADRVLQRGDGSPTYFAGDIAYHLWKVERDFDAIINVWNATHELYVKRTLAALQAAGAPVEKFEFVIVGGAGLKRDGVPLRMGLSGAEILMNEELQELDGDRLKWFFARTPSEKTAEIDIETAARDDETNPAYAVQLLPSRLARLTREAQGRAPQSANAQNANAQNANATSANAKIEASEIEWSTGERELARLVALWPDTAHAATARRSPALVADFALEMAHATRDLLSVTAPSAAPGALRLELLRAAGFVAAAALKTLGIEARDRF